MKGMSPPDPGTSGISSVAVYPAAETIRMKQLPSQHHNPMHSLGEALAGVTIGTNNNTPFALAPGSASTGTNNHSSTNNHSGSNGWGHSHQNNKSTVGPASRALEEATRNSSNGGNSNNAHVRNESLEIFLSQSPSQTLGEEVFKFSHTNLPALAEEERHASETDAFASSAGVHRTASTHQFGEIRAPAPLSTNATTAGTAQDHSMVTIRRPRTESPACSITGTTTSSRSVSPYNSNNPSLSRGGSNPNLAALTNKNTTNSPFGDHNSNSATSPYPSSNNSLNNGASAGVGAVMVPPTALAYTTAIHSQQQHQLPLGMDQQQHVQSQAVTLPANAGQVLYMAVPSPDGRGQVLQPVQMMQLPGKPYTYVLPNGMEQQQQQQPMMVLPMVQQPQQPNNVALSGGSMDNSSSYAIDTTLLGGPTGMNNGGGTNSMNGIRTNSNNPMDSLSSYAADNNALRNDDYGAGKVQPYQMDPLIASLYASPQRPPLDALLGQVRRLSRDQVGCRLVQQALDEEGPMAATLILQEGMPFWGEAMVDPFGNYLFQKILEKITAEERIALIHNVSTRVVNASLNLHGTRSVQKVVELCAQDEQDNARNKEGETAASILTKSLVPAAARLCIDSHGNHVIQRILLRLGPQYSQFIFDAVAASVGDVARHRHGCCVIQRCLDSPNTPARAHLVQRIVEKSLELMQDAYGNYVVQYVLDVCSDEDVHAVCESVVGQVNLLAIQKFSSNVMEKCLERCSDSVKELYLTEMSDTERIRELMMDPFGNYVVQRALSVATHTQAIRLVEAMRPHLQATTGPLGRNGGVRNTAGGRRIIAKICRRFPNFTLNIAEDQILYSQNRGNNDHHNHSNPLQQQPPSHANHQYGSSNHHQQQQHNRYMNHHQQGRHHPHQQQQYQKQQQPMISSYAPASAPLTMTSSQHPQAYLTTQLTSQQQFLDPRSLQQQSSAQQQYGGLGGGLGLGGLYYSQASSDPFAEAGGYSGHMGGGGM